MAGKGVLTELLYGISQFITYIIMALFFIGSLLVRDNADVLIEDMSTACMP